MDHGLMRMDLLLRSWKMILLKIMLTDPVGRCKDRIQITSTLDTYNEMIYYFIIMKTIQRGREIRV
jgi:hypothetical protein